MKILAAAAWMLLATAGAAQAEDKCATKLTLFDTAQLTRSANRDLVAVSINGTAKNFLLDTGASFSMVSRPVAAELKLPTDSGGVPVFDVTGNGNRFRAHVAEFRIGHMRGTDLLLHIAPSPLPQDGYLALDHFTSLDMDVDFGTDVLNYFNQDHCPGAVQYWPGPPAAVIPIRMDGFHIVVPVMLDGHPESALIDTGTSNTTLEQNIEERDFGLTLGDTQTPEKGPLNGDTTLKTYEHQFQRLSFGDVTVTNARVRIIPNAMGRYLRSTQKWMLKSPQDMIIGMDVLRKLHLYIAFGERNMYVAPASVADAGTPGAKAGP